MKKDSDEINKVIMGKWIKIKGWFRPFYRCSNCRNSTDVPESKCPACGSFNIYDGDKKDEYI